MYGIICRQCPVSTGTVLNVTVLNVVLPNWFVSSDYMSVFQAMIQLADDTDEILT